VRPFSKFKGWLDVVWLFASRMAFKVGVLVYTILAARTLSKSGFGDFQVLNGLINVFTQPALVIPMYVSQKLIRQLPASGHYSSRELHSSLRRFRQYGYIAAAFIGLLSFWSTSFIFGIANRGAIVMSSLTIALVLGYYYLIGLEQAFNRFRDVSSSFLISGICIALAAVLSSIWKLDLTLWLMMQLGAMIVGTVFLFFKVSNFTGIQIHFSHARGSPVDHPSNFENFMVYAGTYSVFFLVLNFDSFAAKYILNSNMAADYIQLNFLGKISFVLASSIAMFVFPKLVQGSFDGADWFWKLLRMLGFYLLVCLLLLAILAINPGNIYWALFGRSVATPQSLLVPLLIGSFLQAGGFIMLQPGLAACRRWPLLATSLTLCAQIVLLFVLNSSTVTLAWITLTAGMLLLILSLWGSLNQAHPKK
jgi:O-antigen/teichoic acid export membrane protein